jgi:hypothetical protein
VSGPSETTAAHPGQTFERPLRCRHCSRDFLVRANLDTHVCEEPLTSFRTEAEARANARDIPR